MARRFTFLVAQDVKDLDGIQHFTGLGSLRITDSDTIQNMDKIKALNRLESLTFENCKLEDFSFIKELKELKSLSMTKCNLSDISFLENNRNITLLNLEYNFITDISPLAALENLTILNLDINPVGDILPLENLGKLKRLYIFGVNSWSDEIDEVLSKYAEMLKIAHKIINNNISKNMSDRKKARVLHDYVINNAKYDAKTPGRSETVSHLDSVACYVPYGVLVNKKGACEGYAQAIHLLYNLAGIECHIVRGGRAGSNETTHAWNIAKIDGKYYHVDATWDESIPDGELGINISWLLIK